MVVIAIGIRSLKMLDGKKRKFGWSDLKSVSDWRILAVSVVLITVDFIRQYTRLGSLFNLKEFVVDSVLYTATLVVIVLLLAAYAHYRAEIKREENKKPK